MRALVVDPQSPAHLRLGEAPDPTPRSDQCLVKVEAISLNRGELPEFSGAAVGSVPGWDAAGTVIQAAANGQGPAAGTRVVTWAPTGAWAQLRAVDLTELAPLPDEVDSVSASALPVAGVTALRALRLVGGIVGKRVLITGASGGVGRFAVQLARRGGAYVIAVVGSEARGKGLKELGADEVIVGLDTVKEPIFAVIDNVGGSQLVTAFQRLEEGGSLVSIGYAALEPAVFPPYSTVGPRRHLISFTKGGNDAADLAYLVSLLEKRELDPQIDWQGSWEQAADAIQRMLSRQIAGKAVMRVS